MPFDEVMHKFKHGKLHSGSKSGKRKAEGGDSEYQPKHKKVDTAPSSKFRKRFGV
jgi:hypothetical protein